MGNLRKDQGESNLRQYISKRCLGLGKVASEIDTCSIQTTDLRRERKNTCLP